MRDERNRKPRPPLDGEGLERIALFYAGRYATTRAKLRTYLSRKIKERGWGGEGEAGAEVERLVVRFSELGYVNDQAFATARAASLSRRGYGERRVRAALAASGISEEDLAEAEEHARQEAWTAALRFAQRRRIGPYAPEAVDLAAREKALAAMLRAGHPLNISRRLVRAAPGDLLNPEDG